MAFAGKSSGGLRKGAGTSVREGANKFIYYTTYLGLLNATGRLRLVEEGMPGRNNHIYTTLAR